MLAAHLIASHGVEVLCIFFETPFFSSKKAEKSARSLNLPFKAVDITERHLKIVKNPKHGYGGNMNPCIDCHTLMFRIAGEMLEKEGASFILTGEVLGQRPMSQNKRSLDLIASESGLGRLLLRPLSAKCLSVSIPEEKGWVNREQLMGIQGRSRKPQIEMAKKTGLKEYPPPAGGCLLTEKIFSRRLKDLFTSDKNPELKEIELLKLGRHFRIDHNTKLVVGRDRRENEAIRAIAREDGVILSLMDVPGPTAAVSGDFSSGSLELAAAVTISYSDATTNEFTRIRLTGEKEGILTLEVKDKGKFRDYMI